jgi:metal-sulfur cluster biosynthetic enzyme
MRIDAEGTNLPMDETQTPTASESRPIEPSPTAGTEPVADGSASTVTDEQVREALKHVIDPELGINIVDLGLVYDIEISDKGSVHVEYTLTTMGCPIGPLIEHQMESFLAAVPGVNEVEPEMVLRPAWSPEMISEEAKAALGYF